MSPDGSVDVVLEGLNKIKPVWVELGLQTVHDKTAKFIRRNYPLIDFDNAVENLKARNIEVIAHMIIGLPFETEDMIFKTAEYIGDSGVDGIKFHLLHVLKNTDLADIYLKGELQLLNLEKYTELLIGCIKRIPPWVVIHRMTGDGAKSKLLAPLWSADKKKVLNFINRQIKACDLNQGSLLVKKQHR